MATRPGQAQVPLPLPQPRRVPWKAIAVAAIVLAVLAIAIAIGSTMFGGNSVPHQPPNGEPPPKGIPPSFQQPTQPRVALSSRNLGARQDCSLEGSIKSTRGGTATTIEFFNANSTIGINEALNIYWLDLEGKRQHYKTLPVPTTMQERKNGWYEQATFTTYAWLVANEAEVCAGIFFPAQ